jgi:predicted hydrolase (HD superfamily)
MSRRPLSELLNTDDPAWPLVQQWIADANKPVEVLPAPADAGAQLEAAQVTLRSPMGAIVYHTGGLLIDHGWVRVLGGGGHPRMQRSLMGWNRGRTLDDDGGNSTRLLLVGDDIIGGFFAINGGALGSTSSNSPANSGRSLCRIATIMNLDEARTLMHQWIANPALRVHMECVAACMGKYAGTMQPDQKERWQVCGLLHDMDWEKHPTREEHPFVAVKVLGERGVDDEILTAILGHAEYSGTPRTTPMAKVLFAVDELAGFIVACAKVRPEGVATLEPKSVKKKLKDKAFAAAVSREDIATGVAELGVDETQHIQTCIEAIRALRP